MVRGYIEMDEPSASTAYNRILDSRISRGALALALSQKLGAQELTGDQSETAVLTVDIEEQLCIMHGLPLAVCQFRKVRAAALTSQK